MSDIQKFEAVESCPPNICMLNLMIFWPCVMNGLYIDYQLDAPIIIYS